MEAHGVIYRSAESKTKEQAQAYLQTHQAPHRFLAYRDIPSFKQKYVKGTRALDFGAGTGASSSFLSDLGFDVIGIDVSTDMLEKARMNFPNIHFYEVETFQPNSDFNLVFSSFVLFEIESNSKIVEYLKKAASFLSKEGILIVITGCEHLYSISRNWMTFDANFPENQNLKSGDIAKLAIKDPPMEFYDYYWNEEDYKNCFMEAGLEILEMHHPLGSVGDPFIWQDELEYSPFTVFIARIATKH